LPGANLRRKTMRARMIKMTTGFAIEAKGLANHECPEAVYLLEVPMPNSEIVPKPAEVDQPIILMM
jgi:hypothetical protein